jgi:hypothetical protein
LTPLQRPTELGSKEFFTESEAAEYAKTARERFIKENNLGYDETFSGELTKGVWEEDRSIVPTRRTSLIVGPTGRIPPQTPEAQARARARDAGDRPRFELADSPEERTLTERCLWFPVQGPPMLPSTIYNSNYEFVQTPQAVLIQTELGGSFRIIWLDGRPRLPEATRFWQGNSRGHWEGDTLVVETTNFSEKREFHRRGSDHLDRAVERRSADGSIDRSAVRVRVSRGQLRPGGHSARGAIRRTAVGSADRLPPRRSRHGAVVDVGPAVVSTAA